MAFSVKKILKRSLGGLKMAAAFAPLILTGVGALGFIGCGIGYLATLPSYSKYKDSIVYKQEYINDLKKYLEEYENGNISEDEYISAVERIIENENQEYLEEVLARDIEGNEEWRAKVYNKANSPLGIASLACLGGGILSGVLSLVWIGKDVFDDIKWSADNDFEWEPPKKKKEVVEPTPEPVETDEVKRYDDLSSEEEKLGSTDDFLSSLQ